MNRAIQHQDVLNIKTRFRLFFLAVIFGAAVGTAAGWHWAHKSLSTAENEMFDTYFQAWAYHQAGFGNLSIQNTENRREGVVVDIVGIARKSEEKRGLTANQILFIFHKYSPEKAAEFHKKTVTAFIYFPVGGSFFCVALLIILSTLIKTEERN